MLNWLRNLLGPSREVRNHLEDLKIRNVTLESRASRLSDVNRIQEQELTALKNKARVVTEPVPAPVAKVAKTPKSESKSRRSDTAGSAPSTPAARNDDSLLTNPVHTSVLLSSHAYSSPAPSSRDCGSSYSPSYDSGSSSSYDSSSSSSSCDSGSF